MKNNLAYDRKMVKEINEFEDMIQAEESADPSSTRQIFHTPTEVFKPYYGQAIARYILHQYRLHYLPHTALRIYEIGGGNGTLMLNILDYIREHDPEVYVYTQYCIVEISAQLASKQEESLRRNPYFQEHSQHVEIVQSDILSWTIPVREPCYILAWKS